MQLSIVVTMHNRLELTQAMLASALATLPADTDWEILLVDNASNDGTGDWLKAISRGRIRSLTNETNLPFAAANNRAAEQSRGELVVLLNNDLVLLPGWLDPMVRAARIPGVGIVGNMQLSVRSREIDHAGIHFDQDGRPFHFRPPVSYIARTPLIRPPAATGACMLLKKSIFTQLGGFDEGYVNGYEDVDLCLRAAERGLGVAVSTRSAAYHYISSTAQRHALESANAARFAARWETVARRLGNEAPAAAGAAQSGAPDWPFPRDAYATLQAFHPSREGHSERNSTVHLYALGRSASVAIPLDYGLAQGGTALRLDPCDFPAMVRIFGCALVEQSSGKPAWTASSADLTRLFQVSGSAVARVGRRGCLAVESIGRDPQLIVDPAVVPPNVAARTDLSLKLQLETEASQP